MEKRVLRFVRSDKDFLMSLPLFKTPPKFSIVKPLGEMMSDRLIGIDSLRGCLFETRPLILLRELIFFSHKLGFRSPCLVND